MKNLFLMAGKKTISGENFPRMDFNGEKEMNKISLLSMVLQGIPEEIAITSLAFILAKAKLQWGKIILFGCLMAGIIYFIRLLPTTFGVHTLISMVSMIIFVSSYSGTGPTRCILSVLSSFLLLIIVESGVFYLAEAMGYSYQELKANEIANIIFGYPQVLIIFAAGFFIKKSWYYQKG